MDKIFNTLKKLFKKDDNISHTKDIVIKSKYLEETNIEIEYYTNVKENYSIISAKSNKNKLYLETKDKIIKIDLSTIKCINISDFDKLFTNNITINVTGEMSFCEIKTDSGDINIESTKFRSNKVSTTSGKIDVNGDIDSASSISGNIKANRINNATSVNGNISNK